VPLAPGETGYDGIVIFEHGLQSRLSRFPPGGELVKVQSYPMTVDSRYQMDEEKFGPASIGFIGCASSCSGSALRVDYGVCFTLSR
jgi:hypothetical protein